MPIERLAVSAAIYNEARDKVVGILRNNDPKDRLANLWGLPAVSPDETETDEDGVRRIGWQKLGTEVTPVQLIGEKTALVADDERLTLRLWEATIAALPDFSRRNMDNPDVSHYVTWAWKMPDELIPAAQKKSLCSQILLESEGIVYEQSS